MKLRITKDDLRDGEGKEPSSFEVHLEKYDLRITIYEIFEDFKLAIRVQDLLSTTVTLSEVEGSAFQRLLVQGYLPSGSSLPTWTNLYAVFRLLNLHHSSLDILWMKEEGNFLKTNALNLISMSFI